MPNDSLLAVIVCVCVYLLERERECFVSASRGGSEFNSLGTSKRYSRALGLGGISQQVKFNQLTKCFWEKRESLVVVVMAGN